MKKLELCIVWCVLLLGSLTLIAQPQVTLIVQESAGGCGLATDCGDDIICVDIVMSVDQPKILDSYNIWVEYDGNVISREDFNVNTNQPIGDNSCVIDNGVLDTDLEDPSLHPDHWRVSGVPGMGFSMAANTPYIVHTMCFVILNPNALEGQPICVGGDVSILLTTVTFTDATSDTNIPESCMTLTNAFSSCTLLAETDLSILKSDNTDPVSAGQNIVYTISVINYGPADAQNAMVTDVLPPQLTLVSAVPDQGTWSSPVWNIGVLPAGDSVTLLLTANTNSGFSGAILNTATIATTTTDLVATNNLDTAVTQVILSLLAEDDVYSGFVETPLPGNVSVNDTFPAGSVFSIVDVPSNGQLNLQPDGMFVYLPNPGFFGNDTFVYIVCLPPPNGMVCDTATGIIIIEPTPCVTINASVYLEGAVIDPEGSGIYSLPMRTDLHDLRILPGQSYEDPFLGIRYSPPGQPYFAAPWNYPGTEGDQFDSEGDPSMGDAGYPSNVVDWVLIGLRSDTMAQNGPICQAAALLHSNGQIEFVAPFECCQIDLYVPYFLTIEHRNHLIVMSHEAVPISLANSTLTYDFRVQQSFIYDPLEFGLYSGQSEVLPAVFAMLAGNGNQVTSSQSDTDINQDDRITWETENGDIGFYKIGDHNLNGDVNFNDRVVWNYNNGKFTSVPRN